MVLEKSDITKVVLLGTGTPNADPERCGSAVAIVVHDRPYLVDFGPGVVRRAAAAHRLGINGLAAHQLNRAFLTHLHSDHTAGYPDLILTPWVLGREERLAVYGPAGTQAMTNHILKAYEQDIRERLEGLEPANHIGYQVEVHEIAAGIVYRDSYVSVEALPVQHGSWQAFGYKFATPDRTIVISGDTRPVEIMAEKAAGCDILIHEVYSTAGFATRPPEWQRYHSNVHTSSQELANIAARAKPKLLVLYHQLFWGVSEAALVGEIGASYEGAVISGKDLDIF